MAWDPVRATFQGGLNLEDSVRSRHLVRKQPGCSRQHVWFARIHRIQVLRELKRIRRFTLLHTAHVAVWVQRSAALLGVGVRKFRPVVLPSPTYRRMEIPL